ncbi:MAG: NFACT family protein [candidate division Zixibacteria bacterium]|nr:NFACT family protein [candidate division Zixibacteria bacterium]
MFINSSIICALIPELKVNFISFKIKEFRLSPDQRELVILTCRERESKTILFSADPLHCRMVSLTEEELSPFQWWTTGSLFSQALDAIILNIEQVDFDRVMKFSCQKDTEFEKVEFELYFELTGRNANAILVQTKSGLILDALRKVRLGQSRFRQILPGIKYHLPPAPRKHNPYATSEEEFKKIILDHPEENLLQVLTSHFMGVDELLAEKIVEESVGASPLKPLPLEHLWKGFKSVLGVISANEISPHLILDSEQKPVGISLFDLNSVPEEQKISFRNLNQALQKLFSLEIEQRQGSRKLQTLISVTRNGIEKLKKTEEKLKKELSSLEDAQAYKKYGDLLLNHLSEIKRGAEYSELTDYSTEEHKKIKLPLDPALSAKKNAEAYFKKYQKAQTGITKLNQRIAVTESQLKHLSKIESDLLRKEKVNLEKIESEFFSLGLLKPPRSKKKEKKKGRYSPREFISADGFKILVGRNNKENDYLTFKIAKPDDLWFHAQNVPGSHVVLKKGERKKHPTPKAIQQAASLAAYYSQAKSSRKVTVIYTLAKYVKKSKNAPPGLVKVEKMKSILVEPKLIK